MRRPLVHELSSYQRVKQKTINVHEAKTHLSRLLARVERGEELVIARAGRPVARLLPVAPRSGERALGLDRGQVDITPTSMLRCRRMCSSSSSRLSTYSAAGSGNRSLPRKMTGWALPTRSRGVDESNARPRS